jgi:hypothetical protein
MAATIAITATDIKRVLAYSTVSQLGYMMLALGVGGWLAGMMHLITHAFFKSLLFMCSGSVIHAVHTNEMTEMGGLRKKMPVTAYTMLVGCWRSPARACRLWLVSAATTPRIPSWSRLCVPQRIQFFFRRLAVRAYMFFFVFAAHHGPLVRRSPHGWFSTCSGCGTLTFAGHADRNARRFPCATTTAMPHESPPRPNHNARLPRFTVS